MRANVLPSPYPHTSGRNVSCQGFYGWVKQKYQKSIAVWCRQVSIGLPTVLLCCTVGARVLHLWCQGAALFLALLEAAVFREYEIRQYSYGILSVYLCWTLGTRQLDFWYQTAGLFWYYYSKVFTVAFLAVVGRCFYILSSKLDLLPCAL